MTNDPIRLVLVISNLEYGGAQRQVVELANGLPRDEFDAHVCSLSPYLPLADDLEDRDRRLTVIPKRFKYDVSVVPRLAALLRDVRADLVQSYLFDADIAARLAGRRVGALVIGSERNTDYHLKKRQLLFYRLTRGCMDVMIANSHAGAEFNRRKLGHRPDQYRVIHNGVNVDRFKPQVRNAVRRRLGWPLDRKFVGMFASFKEQKNHPLLFRAARRVLRERADVRFVFVGDELYGGMHGSDAYKRRMDRMVDELEIRPRCLFPGNRKDLPDLYAACDVTVLPSLYEGTPNVALESMACGVPVVATDVSDNALVIPDGRAGYVVPLGDDAILAERIERLLDDPALRDRLGAQARDWVEREFTVARLVEKTARVYRDALNARRRETSKITI